MRERYYQDSNFQGSEFNEAIAQLKRIGELWTLCHLHRRRGNLIQWNVILDCIWMELIADSKDEDENKINEINKKIVINKNNRHYYSQILTEKERFLRKLQEKQNKGSKKQEDLRGL